MKKSLLILAATAIVVSCAKTDSLNETNEIPIGFTKVYIENGTKAITTGAYTTANFETVGNTFGVFGYKTTSTQTDALLFNDQEVEYKSGLSTSAGYNSTTDWAYSPLKYWDKNASAYNFYAYAPHESDFTGTAALSSNSATAFSISGFKQATTQAAMIDLMTDLSSKATVSGNAIGTNDVAFTFGHILSNINVKMAVSDALKADNTDNPVTVVSLTLGAIKMDGDYAYNTTATAYKWTLATSPTTQTFPATQSSGNVFASDALTSVTTGYTDVPAMTNLLFVPQAVDAGYKFVIQYKLNNEVFDAEIPLSSFKNTSNAGLATWEPGNKYTYQIVIGPNPILFDLSGVSDWADGGTYTYVIE